MAMEATLGCGVPAGGGALAISRSRVENALLWFTFAINSIVLVEPAPFDVLILRLIGVGVLSGLRIPSVHVPLVALLGVLAITGLVAVLASDTMFLSGRHILISIFLYVPTIPWHLEPTPRWRR